MQTKKHSFIEAWVNVAIGSIVAFFSQLLVFPFYGIHIHTSQNLGIVFWFTLISVVRSYVIRRWFTRRTEA